MSAVPLLSLSVVRLVLHSFLSDADACRSLRVSRLTATALLVDYTLTQHVVTPPDAPSLRCTLSLYARYGLRVTCLCLPWHLPDEWPPSEAREAAYRDGSRLTLFHLDRQLLPDSLVALVMCKPERNGQRGGWRHRTLFDHLRLEEEAATDGELGREVGKADVFTTRTRIWRRQRLVLHRPPELEFGGSHGWSRHIAPGLLPLSLRYLQLAATFNERLLFGSIPRHVEFLQLGSSFNQPLLPSVLPSGLVELVFGYFYQQPIAPGVLPSSLRRLLINFHFNQPLLHGALPDGLEWLEMGVMFDHPLQPGVLPASLTHLALSSAFNQLLQPGSLPAGLHELSFGSFFQQPLLPATLPRSLRRLTLGQGAAQPLQPGLLPDSLEQLGWEELTDYKQPLLPGALPASLTSLQLPTTYPARLLLDAVHAGALPTSLCSIKLGAELKESVERQLPASITEVSWWPAQ